MTNYLISRSRDSGPKARRATARAVTGWLALLLTGLIALTGCGAASAVTPQLPVTGAGSPAAELQVHEYAIIEQSLDNPSRPDFQQRVQAAVAAHQAGWRFPGFTDAGQGPNAVLADYGYMIKPNPTPPFSSYALYHDDQLVERDIARFWPLAVKAPNQGDFLLAFETLDGQRRVASHGRVDPWPAALGAESKSATTPPVNYGGQIAYAETAGSEVSIYAGSSMESTAGNGDGFGWQQVNGQPLYFYTEAGATHINYAGRTLPYTYDQVLHDGSGPAEAYNPGSLNNITWFYALRDGMWYYVEAGPVK